MIEAIQQEYVLATNLDVPLPGEKGREIDSMPMCLVEDRKRASRQLIRNGSALPAPDDNVPRQPTYQRDTR